MVNFLQEQIIVLTPQILCNQAQRKRLEAEEIKKGKISHFACDAVSSLLSEAERYEQDAFDLESKIKDRKGKVFQPIDILAFAVQEKEIEFNSINSQWNKIYSDSGYDFKHPNVIAIRKKIHLARELLLEAQANYLIAKYNADK